MTSGIYKSHVADVVSHLSQLTDSDFLLVDSLFKNSDKSQWNKENYW